MSKQIAAALHLPARPLYKRLERLLTRLKSELVARGVEGSQILELLGRPNADFGADQIGKRCLVGYDAGNRPGRLRKRRRGEQGGENEAAAMQPAEGRNGV